MSNILDITYLPQQPLIPRQGGPAPQGLASIPFQLYAA
jgi:hypothetical protein